MNRQRQTPEARKASLKKYRMSDKYEECQRRYYQTEKGKESSRRRQAKYHATKKGKETRLRAENKRRRNYGFIKLFTNPFDKNEPIEWHHICDTFVVALPKAIHNYCKPNEEGLHRKILRPVVDEIYFTDDAGTDTKIA